VDYSPGVAPTFLPPGEVIAGVVPGGLQERLAAVAASARELTGGTAALSGAELRQDVAAAQAATGRALTVLGRVQGDSLLAATAQALRTSRAMFARLDSVAAMLAAEAPGSGLQRAAASAGDLAEAAGSARNALERMRLRLDRGEGGVARLSHDSAFRAELDATRRSLDLLLAKYGGRRAPDGPGSR
jgi:hypothetical protein